MPGQPGQTIGSSSLQNRSVASTSGSKSAGDLLAGNLAELAQAH
jgi:hypothetical protein